MHKISDRFEFAKKMNPEHVEMMNGATIYKTIKKGTIISGDGRRCNGIPFVLTGMLRLFRISESGREMTLYSIKPGQVCIMAAICVMGHLDYDFTVEAESTCELAVVSPDRFRKLMDISEPFKEYIFQMMANRLLDSINKIESVNFVSIEQRIKSYLQQHADEDGCLKVTHEQIAIELGSSREVISRNLKKLADEGDIRQMRGKIKILK
jgi:CRP/FNR family transcriptional regulator